MYRLGDEGPALGKESGGSGGQQLEHESAVKGQQYPGVHKVQHSHLGEGKIVLLYYVLVWPHFDHWVLFGCHCVRRTSDY